MKTKDTYYADQLNRIQLHSEYAATVIIKQGVGDVKTNHLNLNDESASELVKWLTNNFNVNLQPAPNMHVFTVKYLGPTNSRGSRIKIISDRFNQSITESYSYEIGSVTRQAEAYLREKGYAITGTGESKDNACYIMSSTFKPLKGK